MGRRIGCVLAISAWSAVACTPAIIGPSYTMEVRLADGRPVRCAVNQPMAPVMSPGTSAPLTTRERNEAEVLAAAVAGRAACAVSDALHGAGHPMRRAAGLTAGEGMTARPAQYTPGISRHVRAQ